MSILETDPGCQTTEEKNMAIFSMILSLLCGVALFLFGMSLMGDGLKMVAGNKLEAFLYRMTNTPLKGVALGTGVTSVIQSSSATTVMVIGFVNSGMMKLKQAIGIIMGANIGTSITGWILCLSYIGGSGGGIASIFSTATISAVVAVIGIIFRMFCKRSVHKNIGNIMLGFAILMTGMQMMSGAVSPLRENPTFIKMLTMFSNPLAGILVKSAAQITTGIDLISNVVHTTSAASQESAAASQELFDQAQVLKNVVDRFKLAENPVISKEYRREEESNGWVSKQIAKSGSTYKADFSGREIAPSVVSTGTS